MLAEAAAGREVSGAMRAVGGAGAGLGGVAAHVGGDRLGAQPTPEWARLQVVCPVAHEDERKAAPL